MGQLLDARDYFDGHPEYDAITSKLARLALAVDKLNQSEFIENTALSPNKPATFKNHIELADYISARIKRPYSSDTSTITAPTSPEIKAEFGDNVARVHEQNLLNTQSLSKCALIVEKSNTNGQYQQETHLEDKFSNLADASQKSLAMNQIDQARAVLGNQPLYLSGFAPDHLSMLISYCKYNNYAYKVDPQSKQIETDILSSMNTGNLKSTWRFYFVKLKANLT